MGRLVPCAPAGLGGLSLRLILGLLLLLESLFQVHLHVALLLVASCKLPAASITAKRFLAGVGPLMGGEMVAPAEGSRTLLRVERVIGLKGLISERLLHLVGRRSEKLTSTTHLAYERLLTSVYPQVSREFIAPAKASAAII